MSIGLVAMDYNNDGHLESVEFEKEEEDDCQALDEWAKF